MGDVHAPARADTQLAQFGTDVLHRVFEAALHACDGQPTAVLSLGHDRREPCRLAHVGHQRRQTSASSEVLKVRRHQKALGVRDAALDLVHDLRDRLACLRQPYRQLDQIAVGSAEGAAVDHRDAVGMLAQRTRRDRAVIRARQPLRHRDVQDLIVRIPLIHLRDRADRGLAAGRHIALMDQRDKLCRLDLFKFAVAAAADGDRKRTHREACRLRLRRGIKGRCVGYDAYHVC